MAQEIDIKGLPANYEVIGINMESDGVYVTGSGTYCQAQVILQLIRPRRITLVETGEIRVPEPGEYAEIRPNVFSLQTEDYRINIELKIWRFEKDK